MQKDLFGEVSKKKIIKGNRNDIYTDYDSFVKKFTDNPKTTDDCYTPQKVYETIKDYVVEKFNLQNAPIIRPFYPGGDYTETHYPKGCVVIDNPPFSTLSKIVDFYLEHNIQFFLFAPCLTLFQVLNKDRKATAVITDSSIEYANKAIVKTSFVSNLYGDIAAITEPVLSEKIKEVQSVKENKLPKYEYPTNIATANKLNKIVAKGIQIIIPRNKALFIDRLDSQRRYKKALFGGGLLVSDDITQKMEEALQIVKEKKKQETEFIWELSQREQQIIQTLNNNE